MLRAKIIALLLLLLLGFASAASANPPLPAEMQNYQWHRAETANFEVLSIDDAQTEALASQAEAVRSWVNNRWGLPDLPFNKKCMILCVPSQDLFKKWFRADNIDPKAAKSKNMDGSDRDVYAIWVTGTTPYLTGALPEKVARVCLMNYEDSQKVHIPKWEHRGMSLLCDDIPTLRRLIGGLDTNGAYTLSALTNDAANDSAKAAALCLFLRKQPYGEAKMQACLRTPGTPQDIAFTFGFQSTAELDAKLNTYIRNLVYDIQHNATPDIGLTWYCPRTRN